MSTDGLEGAWVTRIDGKIFFARFSGQTFSLLFELPQATSISLGTFTVDWTKSPIQIDLTLMDGIGKNGDRLRGRDHGGVVRGIVRQEGDTLHFYAPPPELDGRPDAFPEGVQGFVGENLYLVLKRAV